MPWARVTLKGKFEKTATYLTNLSRAKVKQRKILEQYGERGVAALKNATPKDTGKTANSWEYFVFQTDNGQVGLSFYNTNTGDPGAKYEVNVAVILQYGHATGNGGWVEGRDYINPAIRPIFDEIAESAYKEITQQ